MKWIKILSFLIPFLCLLFPMVSFAKDTDIYMASGEGVEPNILIIFDNSSSMNNVLYYRSYVPSTTYEPDPLVVPIANRDTVYKYSSGNWVLYGTSEATSRIADVPCPAAKNALMTLGQYTGKTAYSGSNCTNPSLQLRTGNYRNYQASGGDAITKLEVAQQIIKDLIDTVNGVRIGIMVFNPDVADSTVHGPRNSHGGSIQSDIVSLTDTNKGPLKTQINAIVANTYTPLAETLYEAGLYFKGAVSYFNSGVDYKDRSPIQWSCQKNFVIIMTDGDPTRDDGYRPGDSETGQGTDAEAHHHVLWSVIGDRDGDGFEPLCRGGIDPPSCTNPNRVHYLLPEYGNDDYGGTDYLDDVAKYLHDTDLRSDLTGIQNIITYTIGFVDTPQHNLLGRTADANHGDGAYYTAADAAQLATAFQHIVGQILEEASSFVAPIVPVSKMEKETAGNKLYLALFQPNQDKMWSGNIKRFGVVQSGANIGQIVDVYDLPAFEDGKISTLATSHWVTVSPDGPDVEKGGVGGILKNRSTARNIYTYLGSNANLAHSSNEFKTTNNNITLAKLGVLTDGERTNVINFVRGYDVYSENESDPKGPTAKRDWILGSFLHSRPLVIHYGETDPSYIFAGSNDGMLHAFNDTSGEEEWAFIPPNLLNKLQAMHADVNAVFVDGSPKAYIARHDDGSIHQAILIFGQRRGGNRYYALDVTTPSSPQYLWEINPDATGSPYVEIGTTDPTTGKTGQTWSSPNIGKIACQTGAPNCIGGERWVAFIGGGYDTNQDNHTVTAADSMGRAVYVVDVIDGSLVRSFSHADSAYSATMTYSIPSDIAKVDTDGNGKIDRLYVGDMGGRMWRFDICDPDPANWTGGIIFESNPGYDASTGRKIFYPPDVTLEAGDYEMLFFGTGDREYPQETDVVNRIYAIEDKSDGRTLTESNLYDVTSDELQTTTDATRKGKILSDLNSADGWLIQLGTAEKSLSAPVVFYKTAYFTTFSPIAAGGPCDATFGTARMYALDYTTGNAVFNLDLTNDIGGIKKGGTDRSEIIGTAIPSGVIITFIGGIGVAYTGVGGGVDMPELSSTKSLVPTYWRIVF
jgi:type IV pilus assembly protein PilY1